jgi:glycerol-3-phosphate cytidylyltransferase
MTNVITYGTFDLFHVGHVRLLQRLRSLGDRLIVGCSTDEFNDIKGKKSVIRYNERAEILSSCKYVDLVIPETTWEQKCSDIQKHDVRIFAMGDDWVGNSIICLCGNRLHRDLCEPNIEYFYDRY